VAKHRFVETPAEEDLSSGIFNLVELLGEAFFVFSGFPDTSVKIG